MYLTQSLFYDSILFLYNFFLINIFSSAKGRIVNEYFYHIGHCILFLNDLDCLLTCLFARLNDLNDLNDFVFK